MKRLSFCLAILLLLSFGLANAQAPGNTAVRVKTVAFEGARARSLATYRRQRLDSLTTDVVLKFGIEWVNRDANVTTSSGYRIYSPMALTGHATGNGGNVKLAAPANVMPGSGLTRPYLHDRSVGQVVVEQPQMRPLSLIRRHSALDASGWSGGPTTPRSLSTEDNRCCFAHSAIAALSAGFQLSTTFSQVTCLDVGNGQFDELRRGLQQTRQLFDEQILFVTSLGKRAHNSDCTVISGER